MKKTKIIACLTALALGVGGVASADTINMGDVNSDGKVSSLDAAWVLKHDAKLITLEGESLTAADYNGDGKVNSLDASKILKEDAGIVSAKTIDHVENFFATRIYVPLSEAYELFWYDEEYVYYFPNIESQLYVVHYTDGTKENIVQALDNGNVSIGELNDLGVWYSKCRLDATAYEEPLGNYDDYLAFKYYRDNCDDYDIENPDHIPPTIEAALDGRAEITGTLQTEGFVNTEPVENFDYSAAEERAKKEFTETLPYGWVEGLYGKDGGEYYVVRLYKESSTMNYKLVYLDTNGVTKLIIHDTPTPVKRIEKIVDESEGKEVEQVKEIFYSDANYNYYFETAKSKYVTVYYNDGTTANIKDAFLNTHNNYGIMHFHDLDYKREHKIFSKRFESFSWHDVVNGTIAGETERITEGFVHDGGKVIYNKAIALEMALRYTDVKYKDYTVYYDGNTNGWCVSFTLADGSYQNVYMGIKGWASIIINGKVD